MIQIKVKNYGFVEPKIATKEEGAEHVLGAVKAFRGEIINPSGDWSPYKPEGELQAKFGETNGCTLFGNHNAIEAGLKLKGIDKNFSEAYGMVSAFLKGIFNPNVGADPHSILEMLRTESGLLDEHLFKLEAGFDPAKKPANWEELKSKAREIYKSFRIKHDWLWTPGERIRPEEKKRRIKEKAKEGVICLSVRAWEFNGTYYIKSPGAKDTHWLWYEKHNDKDRPVVFDSYAEPDNSPFEKELDPLYDFNYGKVIYIVPPEPTAWELFLMGEILAALKKILGLQSKLVEKVIPIDQPPPPPAEPPKLRWDDIKEIQRSIFVVCKEEGLSDEIADRLIKTVKCESGFNIRAKHANKDGSTDYGIAQFNNKYWIGEGKPIPSVEVALNDPEFCIRLMARNFKKGNAFLWVCYKKLFGKVG